MADPVKEPSSIGNAYREKPMMPALSAGHVARQAAGRALFDAYPAALINR
jgi:hypothetical protein